MSVVSGGQVNHSPSFGVDSELDETVKFAVLKDAIRLADIKADNRRK